MLCWCGDFGPTCPAVGRSKLDKVARRATGGWENAPPRTTSFLPVGRKTFRTMDNEWILHRKKKLRLPYSVLSATSEWRRRRRRVIRAASQQGPVVRKKRQLCSAQNAEEARKEMQVTWFRRRFLWLSAIESLRSGTATSVAHFGSLQSREVPKSA